MTQKLSLLIVLAITVLMFTSLTLPDNHHKKIKTGLKNGNIAPEIVLPTPEGEQIALSSLRGKMVFIDFWASWCKGCREVSRKLRPFYEKYKDGEFINGKGFVVLSVSLDTDRERWLNAIEEDSMQCFINVSDLKGFDSPVASDYKFTWVPEGYLIDGNGVIIDFKSSDFKSTLESLLVANN